MARRAWGNDRRSTLMDIDTLSLREQVPLAALTTLGVGGAARYYLHAHSPDAVVAGVAWAAERGLPLLLLGRGSNMVIADDGFAGLVIRMGVRGIATVADGDAIEVTVGAGESWSQLVAHAVQRNWAGLECMAGIPGLVGATPVQNVGAYGQEVHETITRVEAYDRQTRAVVTLENAACAFGYRESRFKRADRERFIILRVSYRLRVNGDPTLRYIELRRLLAERDITHPTLAQVRHAVLEIRRRKSMLLNATDANTRSVGSFFVNPVLSDAAYAALVDAYAGAQIPNFAAGEGWVKVPAAWLIEHVGFPPGYRRGAVGLSSKHTLALINHGQASAAEILALARDIRARVHERFGLLLAPEPTFVGVSLEG